jgi:hypothetical protein
MAPSWKETRDSVILVSRALPPVSGQEPGQDFDFDVDPIN